MAEIAIKMPQLGESVHEGTIGRWLVQVGDTVAQYDPLCEVITDKVTAEVTSTDAGTIRALLVAEGETVVVGTPIAQITDSVAAPVGAVSNRDTMPQVKSAETQIDAAFEEGLVPVGAGRAIPPQATGGFATKPHRYSPVVRRIAREHGLDLDTLPIQGTGLAGRITRDDVMRYVNSGAAQTPPISVGAVSNRDSVQTPPAPTPAALPNPPVATADDRAAETANRGTEAAPTAAPFLSNALTPPRPAAPQSAPDASGSELPREGEEYVGLTPMRRAIAAHMVQSKTTTPHAWTMVEVDMTRLAAYRGRVKAAFEQREGVALTFLPFVLRAVVEALRAFPTVNAAWAADGNGIIIKRDLNLGVAVDVPDGLIVPVIHRADEKSLVGLARAVNDLATRARAKKLTVADVQGGTFTVNNPGAFGSVISYPVINPPQAAIITMEAIIKRPVVRDDAIAIRSMMNMGLSFDHRVIDGATAGRFLQAVKKWLEGFDPQGNLTTW